MRSGIHTTDIIKIVVFTSVHKEILKYLGKYFPRLVDGNLFSKMLIFVSTFVV